MPRRRTHGLVKQISDAPIDQRVVFESKYVAAGRTPHITGSSSLTKRMRLGISRVETGFERLTLRGDSPLGRLVRQENRRGTSGATTNSPVITP